MALESLNIPLENIISKEEVREKNSLETSPSEQEVRDQIKLMLKEKLQAMYSEMQESKKNSASMTASQTFENDAVIIDGLEKSKSTFEEMDMEGSAFFEIPTGPIVDELEEFKLDAVVIPRAVASLNIAPQKAKLLSSSNENQTIIELSPKDEFEEGLVHVDKPTFVELCSTKYFDSILSGAKTLWAAKSHLPVAASTALAMYSYFPLFAGAGALLATGAGMEYAMNGNCEYSKAALGIGTTITGLSTGAPLMQKMAVAGISTIGIITCGASIFNPTTYAGAIIGGSSGFMLSKAGYFLTSAFCFGVSKGFSNLMNNHGMLDYLKEFVRTNFTYEVQAELGRQADKYNNMAFGYMPIGKIISPVTNYINNTLCAKTEALGNNIAEKVSNLGKDSEESFVKQWSSNGDKFISSFEFIYKNLVEFAPSVYNFCKDYYQQRNSFAANVNQSANVFREL